MQQPSTQIIKMESSENSQSPRESLDAAMKTILGVDGGNAHFILPFVRKGLHQFHLSSFYNEFDVVFEAYERAVRHLDRGGTIDNLPAWFKSTCYNIIRERSKQREKQLSIFDRIKNIVDSIFHSEEIVPNYAVGKNLEWLTRSLHRLTPEQKLILELRIVKGLPWKDVAEHFVREQLAEKNDRKLQDRLRKEYSRLLKSLRHNYGDCFSE